MNTSAYLIDLLKRYDVDVVFGIPGVHTLELYRALQDSTIQNLTPRHEQAAGFMADGYARRTGKPGVCFVISGPGMTNIATAMAQAWADSIPMLVISSVNAHGRMGSGEGWLHELPDQRALIGGVCAFSHTLHTAAELPTVLARAFAVFDSGRPRPVHLELPINVLAQDVSELSTQAGAIRVNRPMGSAADIVSAALLINSARAPVILVGGGASRAHESVLQLAEQIDAPVVMSVNGRGILPVHHPLAVGASASLPPVRWLIGESDLVIAIGTEFGPTDYDFYEDGGFDIPGKLIRIDIDAQQLMRTQLPDLGIVGDAQSTLDNLLPHLELTRRQTTGAVRASHCVKEVHQSLSPRYACYVKLLDTIRDACTPPPVIIGDSTQIIYAGNSAYCSTASGTYFNSATGFGTLGYALPAAIGAAVADTLHTSGSVNNATLVAIVGDGGLQFSVGELSTAIDAKVKLMLIVHENGGYVEIKQSMLDNNIPPVGVELFGPDIMMQAAACGWTTHRLSSLDDITSIIEASAQDDHPVLALITDELFDQ